MRLAFLTHEPFHPPSGGGSAEAPYLVREMVRRGHDVHVFCPAFPEPDRVAAEFGIRVHPFTRWAMGRYTRARNLKYLLYPAALGAWVRRVRCGWEREHGQPLRFDLLFAQHTISAVAAGRLRRQLGVPAVLNFLDYLTGFMETWPALFTRTGFVPALTRFELGLPRRYGVEGVLAVSEPLAGRFAATGYPRDRILAIQYGYDAARFLPSPEPVAVDPPVVVMHGSFDRHHLGPIAAAALADVHLARPDVVVRFVGRETPVLLAFVEALRRRRPGIQVQLTGFIPYPEVAGQLRTATLGIVPYEESLGTHCAFVAKAVEYLGCGLPVASTPLENLRGYFQDEPAVRFSSFTGAGLARVILEWLEVSPARRRELGLHASSRVARELDWPVIAGRALDFVEQVRPGTGTTAGHLRS